MIDPITHTEADDSVWKSLYKVGAVAALTVLVLMSIQIVVLIMWPPPSTVIGWFDLFQTNKLVGLLDMDLLLIVDYALLGLVFLAFWAALRRVNQSFMVIALVFELVGIVTYFASTAAFEMLCCRATSRRTRRCASFRRVATVFGVWSTVGSGSREADGLSRCPTAVTIASESLLVLVMSLVAGSA